MSVVVQSSYRPQIARGVVGMIADEADCEVGTRIVETSAGIGFGLAVSQGTGDKGCVIGGSKFIGITVRDITQDRMPIDPYSSTEAAADVYPQYANAGVMSRGHIWLLAHADVAAGDALYYDTTAGTFGNSASGEAASGSITFTEQPAEGQTATINGTKVIAVAEGTALTQATSAATATTSPTLTFSPAPPSWLVAGLPVYDVTTSQPVGTISAVGATTVTLAANAANAVGQGDVLSFGGFNLGPTLGDTIDNLANMLNASADANLVALKYQAYPLSPGGAGEGSGATSLLLADKTVGTGGNSVAFSTTFSGATTSGSTLSGGTSSGTAITGGYWKTSAIAGEIAIATLGIQR